MCDVYYVMMKPHECFSLQDGNTAADLAKRKGHDDLASLLEGMSSSSLLLQLCGVLLICYWLFLTGVLVCKASRKCLQR